MFNLFNWWKMRKGSWTQGVFNPEHPEKCINLRKGKKPFARSSWEFKMMAWCDQNKNVVRWGSEIIAIPYIFDLEKVNGIHKTHNYYPDIYCEIRNKKGLIDIYIIEIKPIKQKNKPIVPKNKTRKAMKNYRYAVNEYVRNQNKWRYAKMFCEGKNWNFRILTEQNIFNGVK